MKILITGASSQITQAIKKYFSQDEVITTSSSISGKESIEFNLNNASVYVNNLPKDIDVLILNAATYTPPRRRLHEMTIDKIAHTIDADLLGNITLLHHYLPQMMEKKFGRIIFISSVSTTTGTSKYPIYISCKAALEGLMKNIVVDYGHQGITANTIQLGLFKTERTKFYWENPQYEDKVNTMIPAGRMGMPDDINAIIRAVIDSPYMNGANILLSGGFPLISSPKKNNI